MYVSPLQAQDTIVLTVYPSLPPLLPPFLPPSHLHRNVLLGYAKTVDSSYADAAFLAPPTAAPAYSHGTRAGERDEAGDGRERESVGGCEDRSGGRNKPVGAVTAC